MKFDEQQQVRDFTITATATGANEIIAAVAGKVIRVLSYTMSVTNSAVVGKWQSKPAGSAVELSGLGIALAFGKEVTAPHNPCGWFETVAGSALHLNLGGSPDVHGCGTYILQ
jgi:hypothetical protein